MRPQTRRHDRVVGEGRGSRLGRSVDRRHAGTSRCAAAARAASSRAMRASRFAARRSMIVLRATRPTAPTKTIVPMTWICGGRLVADAGPDPEREGLLGARP